MNGVMVDICAHHGEILSTGFFTTICGESVGHMAKLSDNQWLPFNVELSDPGHSLFPFGDSLFIAKYEAVDDSNALLLYYGETLTEVGEKVTLTSATGFSNVPNIYDVLIYQGEVLISGEFDVVGDDTIRGVARWDGTQWNSMGIGLADGIDGTTPLMYPHQMKVYNDQRYVVGNFKYAGGVEVNGVARWDGTQWHAMGQGFNGTVYAIEVFKDTLWVAGSFTQSGANDLLRMAYWDGQEWKSPDLGFIPQNSMDFSYVHTLYAKGDVLYVGGGLRKW